MITRHAPVGSRPFLCIPLESSALRSITKREKRFSTMYSIHTKSNNPLEKSQNKKAQGAPCANLFSHNSL